jgi:hypothetical protein
MSLTAETDLGTSSPPGGEGNTFNFEYPTTSPTNQDAAGGDCFFNVHAAGAITCSALLHMLRPCARLLGFRKSRMARTGSQITCSGDRCGTTNEYDHFGLLCPSGVENAPDLSPYGPVSVFTLRCLPRLQFLTNQDAAGGDCFFDVHAAGAITCSALLRMLRPCTRLLGVRKSRMARTGSQITCSGDRCGTTNEYDHFGLLCPSGVENAPDLSPYGPVSVFTLRCLPRLQFLTNQHAAGGDCFFDVHAAGAITCSALLRMLRPCTRLLGVRKSRMARTGSQITCSGDRCGTTNEYDHFGLLCPSGVENAPDLSPYGPVSVFTLRCLPRLQFLTNQHAAGGDCFFDVHAAGAITCSALLRMLWLIH